MSRRKRRGGVEPTKVDGQMTARSMFYRKELHRVIKGIFKVECPEDWEVDYMLNWLTMTGYLIITDSPAGILPLRGSLTGYNYWDYPTGAVITVPTIDSFTVTIGEECQIVFLERTYYRHFYSFAKLMEIYAYKLAAADAGIDVNLMNSRVAYMAEAESKAQAETIKTMYEEVTEGTPFVVYRTNALDKTGLTVFFNNVKQNYVADLIQDSKRTIMNEFLTWIGINNANTDKRERLLTDEVNANNIELSCNVSIWKHNLEITSARVNKLFPTIPFNISLQYDTERIMQMTQTIIGGNNDSSRYDRNISNEQ